MKIGNLLLTKNQSIRSVALALCMSSATALSQPAMAANIYALIDVSDAGTAGIVRANIPLPENFLGANETMERLGVIDSNGDIKLAQTDVVERYPNGSVSIVQLTAAVDGKSSQGESTGFFKVTDLPPAQQLPKKKIMDLEAMNKLEPAVKNFLMKKALWVQAIGPFGEKYFCNLLDGGSVSGKIYKVGHIENTVSLACDLKPANGFNINAKKEVPQLLSIRAFVNVTQKSPAIKVDMLYGNTRATNGANIGKAYFKSLSVAVPKENIIVNDVAVPSYDAKAYPSGAFNVFNIIKPREDGSSYVAVPGTWHMRKLAITTADNAAQATAELGLQGYGFAKRAVYNNVQTFSWENSATARFGVGEATPNLLSFISAASIKTKWNNHWNTLKNILQNGLVEYPFNYTNLGDTHPYYIQYGGATSGFQIDMIAPGGSGVNAGAINTVRWYQYIMGAYLDRQHNGFFIQANGEPWQLESALVSCTANGNPTGLAQKAQFSPIDGTPINLTQDDPLGINASSVYDYHRLAAKKPDYEPTLLGFSKIDFQHDIRVSSKWDFLVTVINDPVARYLAEASVENIRASLMTMYSKNSSKCEPLTSTLLVNYNHVYTKPGKGKGVEMGRAHADMIKAIVSVYAMGDDQMRNKLRPLINTVTDVITDAQVVCSGFTEAVGLAQGKALGAGYDNPAVHKVMQSIEEARIDAAREMLVNKALKGFDNARAEKVRQSQLLYYQGLINPAYTVDGVYIPQAALVYNAALDQAICPSMVVPEMLKKGNGYEQQNSLVRAADRTGNDAYLNVANSILKSSPDLTVDLQKNFTNSVGGTYNWDSFSATALDLIQKKNGD